jgi:hypothetical protein
LRGSPATRTRLNPPREQGHQRSHDYGPLSSTEIEALNASAVLDALEDAGDQVRLLALSDVYTQRAALARGYGELLVAAERLTSATAAYDRLLKASTADELSDQLVADGLTVLDLDAGSSPTGLTDAAKLYTRLARIASEAAAGIKQTRELGELLGVGP